MFINLENVNKTINGSCILKNINVKIEKGSCCGFVGRNGCGKTMLLRTVAGYMSTDGEVECDGKIVGNGKFIKNAGLIIGETDFISGMSGYNNLKALAQINSKVDDERINEVLRAVGLFEAKDKKYRKYSLGMKQRLRIAQAIMEYPEILILDEPFNGLDKTGCTEIMQLLEQLKKEKVTILLTSHNDSDIKRLCDKVYEMDNGKIINEVNIDEN